MNGVQGKVLLEFEIEERFRRAHVKADCGGNSEGEPQSTELLRTLGAGVGILR
jgi:hypothetical protein